MLETPEDRARLRQRLETWPDDRKSPVTINQGIELLDLVERLEKEADYYLDRASRTCPVGKNMNKCEYLDSELGGVFAEHCYKCWRKAAQIAVEQQNERK